MAPVTIRTLRAAYQHLFHPNQDWFEHEAFMDRPLGTAWGTPTGVCKDDPDCEATLLVPAVSLVAAYVADPTHPVWRDYLWTHTTDRAGQRVYVGGVANGRGFELHRHLRLTARWGVPTW